MNLVFTKKKSCRLLFAESRDMFYDTIYESRPGSSILDKEAGYIMAEKLISMKKGEIT